jgi:hypothetical protein
MPPYTLPFEKPVVELENKLKELIQLQRVPEDRRVARDRPHEEADRRHAAQDLQRTHPVAEGPGGPPPAAPLHPRLRAEHVHGLDRNPRRPQLPGRPRHHRRLRPHRRRARHAHRHPEGARHEEQPGMQLRLRLPGGLPQGAAPDEARQQVPGAHHHADRHPRRLSRHRIGRTPHRGSHRRQPARDVHLPGPHHRHHHR